MSLEWTAFWSYFPTDRILRRILYYDEANDGGKAFDMYVRGTNLEFIGGCLFSTSICLAAFCGYWW
jgi:hypothetical protein